MAEVVENEVQSFPINPGTAFGVAIIAIGIFLTGTVFPIFVKAVGVGTAILGALLLAL